MTAEQMLLIDALRAAMTGGSCALNTDVDWSSFLRLASSHSLLPLVCDGIRKVPDAWEKTPKNVQAHLSSAYKQAIYQDTQRDYTKQQLTDRLTEARIPHIFLRGSVLKYDYPEPALRTMTDLDILVYAKDFKEIAKIAQSLGAETIEGDGNHRNYGFPGNVLVEFHPNLLHHATAVGTGINPGWQYAKKDCPGYAMELTEEGFYLNTICHIAEHFVNGGIGVRFVLDIWVSRHLRKQRINRDFIEAELTRLGLLDFAQKLEQLSDTWFGGLPMTPLMEELGLYILTSGSHGMKNRATLNSLSLSSGGSRFSALWKKAFYPKAELEDRFPWCKGRSLLLPAAWCARAYNAVTKHGDIILKWSKDTGKISKEQVAENRKKLKRFGIDGNKES